MDFLDSHAVAYSFSLSGSSQSTGMVEVGNKLLQEILRKGGDWEDNLSSGTRSLNSRIIAHFTVAPCEILMSLPLYPDMLSLTKPSATTAMIQSSVAILVNPAEHSRLVQQYLSYRA